MAAQQPRRLCRPAKTSTGASATVGVANGSLGPLLGTGKPTAGTGLTASELGTAPRSGGSRQVTYNGHPLYLFVKDTKPGDVTGEGVSALSAGWFALSPSGSQIPATPPSSASGGASSGGGY